VLTRIEAIPIPKRRALIVADRGFGDQKLYQVLTEELKFDYLIRFPWFFMAWRGWPSTLVRSVSVLGAEPTGQPSRSDRAAFERAPVGPETTLSCFRRWLARGA